MIRDKRVIVWGLFCILAAGLAFTVWFGRGASPNTDSSTEYFEVPEPHPVPLALDMREETILHGARMFRLCRSCHTVKKGGANRVGPNLYNLFGAPVASRADYVYSKVLRKAGASGMVWTPEYLYAWLKHPREFLKGHKMTFIGIPKSTDRLAIISYLKAFSDTQDKDAAKVDEK